MRHQRPDDAMTTPNLPTYGEPPVVEVVSGVMFDPIPGFKVPLIGKFWSSALPDFPKVEEQPPLAPTIEILGRGPGLMFVSDAMPAMPRTWFVNGQGDQIVQLQRDRFLCNWRKTSPSHAYPRYGQVIDFFEKKLSAFQDFIDQECGVALVPRQYELTYVNHLERGPDGVFSLGALGRLLPDLSWRNLEDRWLPTPEDIGATLAFPLPQNAGRLRVRIQSGMHVPANNPVLALEITARGYLEDRPKWFNLAHIWIVKAFEDLTSQEMNTVWSKQ
jgi:uncharacterized protein (TIGR04255 family)